MPSVICTGVTYEPYAECRCSECRYAAYHYADCRGANFTALLRTRYFKTSKFS